jgi:hypothetical protein
VARCLGADLSRAYKAPTLSVNCIGECDGGKMLCSGGSAAWDAAGQCIGRLPPDKTGVLVFNVEDGSAEAVVCEGGSGSSTSTQQSL